jgi:hypothetical protein
MKLGLRLSLVAVLWIACTSDARAQWSHVNGKLRNKSVPIRKALVLPAQVTFVRQGAKGSEDMALEAGQVGASFLAAVSRELAVRGVEVLPNGEAKDDATRYALSDLQAARRSHQVGVHALRPSGCDPSCVLMPHNE